MFLKIFLKKGYYFYKNFDKNHTKNEKMKYQE